MAPSGNKIITRLQFPRTQALFMLVAVVLAFAIEEWREKRELEGIAVEARSAIPRPRDIADGPC